MKNTLLKSAISALLFGFFLFLSYGSGKSSKEEENKIAWKKNYVECFCGRPFKFSHTIDNIDMKVKTVTILNCDGTYTSQKDWGTSKRNEEVYNNTVGKSSDNVDEFAGKWEIVSENIPTEVEEYFTHGGFKPDEYTIIIYKSNSGLIRYAYIQSGERLKDDSKLYLGQVILKKDEVRGDSDYTVNYELYEGFTE